MRSYLVLIFFPLLLSACASKKAAEPAAATATVDPAEAALPSPDQTPPPTVVEASGTVVAIGDLHGDLEATRNVLRLAGAMDGADRWIGKDLVVVQTGDRIDRGDDDRVVLDLLERLSGEAAAAGGALYTLVGNHEVMNVEHDLRYVTEGAMATFADIPHDPADPRLIHFAADRRGRVAAFRPGGPYARLLAGDNVVMVVGGTVFAHGGVLPAHLEVGLESINREAQAWMRGERGKPDVLDGDDSPIWSRHYSDEPDEADCALLAETLTAVGARRMVVGHTVHKQIDDACGGQVWRIDVGLAGHYGHGGPAALQIDGDQVTIIR